MTSPVERRLQQGLPVLADDMLAAERSERATESRSAPNLQPVLAPPGSYEAEGGEGGQPPLLTQPKLQLLTRQHADQSSRPRLPMAAMAAAVVAVLGIGVGVALQRSGQPAQETVSEAASVGDNGAAASDPESESEFQISPSTTSPETDQVDGNSDAVTDGPEIVAGNSVVRLSFDDSDSASTASDSSGSGNDGLIDGASYVKNSADGSPSSLQFDGVADGVSLGALDVSGSALTLAAWVNADSFPESQSDSRRDPRIVAKATSTANDDHVFMLSTIDLDDETVLRGRLRVEGKTHTLIAGEGTSLQTATWHHTALVYDGSQMTLYLDGKQVAQKPLTGKIDQDTTGEVSVGENPGGGRNWDGLLDEVVIERRAFSAAEVEQQAQKPLPVEEKEPEAESLVRLSFDDSGSSSTASDSSGNGNDGSIRGASYATVSADGSPSSLRFDGVDDAVSLGTLDIPGNGLTLAAWVNADSFPESPPSSRRDPRIVSKATGTERDAHLFMLGTIDLGDETVLRGRLRVAGKTHTLIAKEGTSLETGAWYHTAMVYDGSKLTLYLNGEEVGQKAVKGPIDQDPSAEVSVGQNPGGERNWDGLIDEVIIARRAYSAAELAAEAAPMGATNQPMQEAPTVDEDADNSNETEESAQQ